MKIRSTQQTDARSHSFFAFSGGSLEEIFAPLSAEQRQLAVSNLPEVESLSKVGETTSLSLATNDGSLQIVVAGLGDPADFQWERLRKTVGKAFKEWERLKSPLVAVHLTGLPSGLAAADAARTTAETTLLAAYRFDKYLSEKKTLAVDAVDIVAAEDVTSAVADGVVLAETTIFARDLVNEPANVLSPAKLAEAAADAGKNYGFEVEISGRERIEELGMKAYLEVSRASANEPKLIVMRYKGAPERPEDIIGLVGKGLTYDSGGLSIKPNDGMLFMKCDMGGAAAVIGAMAAIAKLKPKANVTAVVAACENMIAGNAYRPGDIIQSMAGKSIFIGSTDAEGRLTLADALTYIIEHEKAAKVVDVATLTGAAIIALGHVSTAVVTNDQDFYRQLETASQVSGEKVWQLPNFDEYKELIKHKIADLSNTGGRAAGTVTAGLFVGEFAQKKPWLHLDIAGTAFSDKAEDYAPEGGKGVGVRLLYQLVKLLEQ